MPTSAMRWFVGLTLLLSGCMIWDDEVSRATAGGLLSKPIVRATLTRHREWVISEPLEELTWPADHQQPVPDYSWLAWSLAALTGLAAGVLWLRWRARKRAARPAEQPPAS